MTTAQDVLLSVLMKAGLDYLNPTVSSTDPQVAEIVDLINETGKDLALRGEWQAMLASSPVGPLPADFGKPAIVVTGAGVHARRVTDPGHWSFLAAATHSHPYYRISNGAVEVVPAGPATLSYWSSHWSDAGESVSADGDAIYLPLVPMISGALYRWLRKKGMPFDDQMAQHEAEVAAAQKADRGL